MPDRDVIERGLTRAWREPYRLLKGGHEAEIVAESLVRAIAADLRGCGGLPAFERVLEAYMKASPPRGKVRSLAEMSRTIEHEFGKSRETQLLTRAAQRSAAKAEAGRLLPGAVPLAKEFLRSFLRHNFFSRVMGRLIGKRFTDIQAARAVEARVWQCLEPQLSRLARSIAANPEAGDWRAPRAERAHRSTADLLDAPLAGKVLP